MQTITIVETHDLRKVYGEVVALDDVTLTVPSGAVAFLGPNGAGKTTFIKLILGIAKPTKGSFSLLGVPQEQIGDIVKSKIGYMPEIPSTVSNVTGVQFVRHMALLSGLPYEVAMQRTHEVLDYVSLEEERYRETKNYSTGMRQRLLLAQALVHDPAVIICDEPTSGLDPAGREDILALLKDLVSTYGKSLFFSTHILRDVEQTCDHLILLNHGKVVYEGAISEIKKRKRKGYLIRFTNETKAVDYLTTHGIHYRITHEGIIVDGNIDVRELYRRISKIGAGILAFQPYEISMDDLFIEMIK